MCSLSAVCAFEQFVVAKKGIEKQSEVGDAEALANVDEAVVLESDSHFGTERDSTTTAPLSPLTFLRVFTFAAQDDLASLRGVEGAIGAHRPPGGDGRGGGCADKCE